MMAGIKLKSLLFSGGGGGGFSSAGNLAIIVDQKANGFSGQSLSSLSPTTRELNTFRANVGSIASLSSNQITLGTSGTYLIEAFVPTHFVEENRAYLREISPSAGNVTSSQNCISNNAVLGNTNILAALVTITEPTVYEIQNVVAKSLGLGGGVFCGFGENEIYTTVVIRKITDTSVAILTHEEANNVSGGATTSGVRGTRPLNVEVSDPDSIVTLSSNQFTLISGKYIIKSHHVFANGANCQVYLQNITDASQEDVATNGLRTSNGSVTVTMFSFVDISSDTTYQYEFERNQTNTDGLGDPCNFGDNEKYAVVVIERIGDSSFGGGGA